MHSAHPISTGRRSFWRWLSARGERREHRESEDVAPAKIACGDRPVIARDFSDLDFRPWFFTSPSFLLASYPFVPFIQRPFVSWRLSVLRRSPILPSLSLSRRIYPSSYLSCANCGATLRYFAGFILGNIWWLACGQRELALPGNLRRQGGGSRTRLGPFTCV